MNQEKEIFILLAKVPGATYVNEDEKPVNYSFATVVFNRPTIVDSRVFVTGADIVKYSLVWNQAYLTIFQLTDINMMKEIWKWRDHPEPDMVFNVEVVDREIGTHLMPIKIIIERVGNVSDYQINHIPTNSRPIIITVTRIINGKTILPFVNTSLSLPVDAELVTQSENLTYYNDVRN